MTPEARMRLERANMDSLFKHLSTERVTVRAHGVIIKGNTKTKDSLIESEVEAVFRDATSFQQLLRAAGVANARLQDLDIFYSVNITLDAGPPELSGTANAVIEVSEAKNSITGVLGIHSKPEDGSVAYGWGQTSEVSTKLSNRRRRPQRRELQRRSMTKRM